MKGRDQVKSNGLNPGGSEASANHRITPKAPLPALNSENSAHPDIDAKGMGNATLCSKQTSRSSKYMAETDRLPEVDSNDNPTDSDASNEAAALLNSVAAVGTSAPPLRSRSESPDPKSALKRTSNCTSLNSNGARTKKSVTIEVKEDEWKMSDYSVESMIDSESQAQARKRLSAIEHQPEPSDQPAPSKDEDSKLSKDRRDGEDIELEEGEEAKKMEDEQEEKVIGNSPNSR